MHSFHVELVHIHALYMNLDYVHSLHVCVGSAIRYTVEQDLMLNLKYYSLKQKGHVDFEYNFQKKAFIYIYLRCNYVYSAQHKWVHPL